MIYFRLRRKLVKIFFFSLYLAVLGLCHGMRYLLVVACKLLAVDV